MTATIIARCSHHPAVRPKEQFYCTIGVDGVDGMRDARTANAYALCVDRSPSMQEPAYAGGPERWVLARDAARSALSRLDDRVNVSLIPYSSEAPIRWSGTAQEAKRDLDSIIGSLEAPADGMTNFEEALKMARVALIPIATAGRRILLFTDGNATEGKGATNAAELVPIRSALADSGIFVDAIGIGKDTRTDVLELLVGNTGRLEYAGETADDAKRLADKVFAALTAWNSTVGSLQLFVRVSPPFDVLEAWHYGPTSARLDEKYINVGEKGTDLEGSLGAIGCDSRQQPVLLLTLRAPQAEDPELHLLKAAGHIQTGSDKIDLEGANGDYFVDLTITVSERGGQRDPVMENMRNACELRERWMSRVEGTTDASTQAGFYERAIAEAHELGNPDDIIAEFQDALSRLQAGQDPSDVANVFRASSSKRKTNPRQLLGLDRQVPSEGPTSPFTKR